MWRLPSTTAAMDSSVRGGGKTLYHIMAMRLRQRVAPLLPRIIFDSSELTQVKVKTSRSIQRVRAGEHHMRRWLVLGGPERHVT